MILIQHQINSIQELKKVPFEYGVEIDLRSDYDGIYLSHDPFIKGERFSSWIKHYQHKFLILNIKEEGLEIEIHKILEKNKVEDFFFLDCSFPYLIKTSAFLQKRICARYSEFESLETVINLRDKVRWVWVDCFRGHPLDKITYTKFQSLGLKICLVSPELTGFEPKRILEFQKEFSRYKIKPDAICSKHIGLWTKD